MNKLPDYSEYLNKPGMLEYIEQEWQKSTIHEHQADFVLNAVRQYGIKSIIEIGCSTGNLALKLATRPDTPSKLKYKGVDANEAALEIARNKVPQFTFVNGDIRTFKGKADLIVCFALFKHFSLTELPAIAARVKGMGKYLIFDMPYAEHAFDDGIEHHHTWAPIDFFGFSPIAIDQKSNFVEPMYLV